MIERLYYGCGTGPGHVWFVPAGAHPKLLPWTPSTTGHPEGCPFGFEVDGYMQPDGLDGPFVRREVEGHCRLETRVNGTGPWTCIAWWDRSVDARFASCSAFVAKGGHTFDEMLVLLKESFPWVLARCKFPLVLVDQPARERSRR